VLGSTLSTRALHALNALLADRTELRVLRRNVDDYADDVDESKYRYEPYNHTCPRSKISEGNNRNFWIFGG